MVDRLVPILYDKLDSYSEFGINPTLKMLITSTDVPARLAMRRTT